MIHIKKEKENLYLQDIEEIIKKAQVIEYNENTIDIPGIAIIKSKDTGYIIDQILNPGLEIIEVTQDEIDLMIEKLVIYQQEDKVMSFDKKSKPKRFVLLNLENIANSSIFTRFTEDTVYVNNYIFTNNEIEFHGSGMFTSNKVYFLNFENLKKIKDVLINE